MRVHPVLLCVLAGLMWQPMAQAYRDDTGQDRDPSPGRAPTAEAVAGHANDDLRQRLDRVPLVFERNVGHYSPLVRYVYRGAGYAVSILPDGFVLESPGALPARSSAVAGAQPAPVSVRFIGANPNPLIEGTTGPGTVNYLLGNRRDEWKRDVPLYSRVRVRDVYPGIDVVYHGNNGQFEFDFEIAPNTDPALIRLAVTGVSAGLPHPVPSASDGRSITAVLRIPRAYQDLRDSSPDVDASFVSLAPGVYEIALGKYDRSRPLVVDPVLNFSTYLGGTGADQAFASAVDSVGNVYLALHSTSTNLPTFSAYQDSRGAIASVYVAKFTRQANQLVLAYATYIGNAVAEVRGLAVDGMGQAYVTGSTSSSTFPVINPLQEGNAGLIDGYVVKLAPSGNDLVYSTYFGGNSIDRGRAIALDVLGNAYITGVTSSTNFPVTNAYQGINGGALDCFVLKLGPSGNALVFSTYLGGSDLDYGAGIAVDSQQNAYVSGNTSSSNFPVASAFQPIRGGGNDAFVAKLNAAGEVQFSTYFGGSGDEYVPGIALDRAGRIYLAGQTSSANLLVINSAHASRNGNLDAFVVRLDSMGNPDYSRYLGGSGDDVATTLSLDSVGHLYVGGSTTSGDFPMTLPLRTSISGVSDAFVSVLDIPTDTQLFSTYVGGGGVDQVTSIVLDNRQSMIVAGYTDSADFSLAYPYQATPGGGSDAFFMVASSDADMDGVIDWSDNCPSRYNPDQRDTNVNGIGDVCEPPNVSGFWPGSGPPNTLVFTFGSHFTMNSQVYVNGIRAPNVQFIDANTLIFMLPAGNTAGPVAVSTPNGTASSAASFGVSASGVQISGFWPAAGPVGTFEFVFGSGFVPNQSVVSINGAVANAVQVVDDRLLIFIVPAGTTTGPIQVRTPAAQGVSPTDFVVQ